MDADGVVQKYLSNSIKEIRCAKNELPLRSVQLIVLEKNFMKINSCTKNKFRFSPKGKFVYIQPIRRKSGAFYSRHSMGII